MVYSFGAAPVKRTLKQFKVLRMIVNAPWYIRNTDLYRDLGIKAVAHEIQRYAKDHVLHLRQHVDEKVSRLILNGSQDRRLKRVILQSSTAGACIKPKFKLT